MGTLRIEHCLHIWVELSGLSYLEWSFESVQELAGGFSNLVRLSFATIQNRHPTVIIAKVACHDHLSLPITFNATLGNFAFKVHIKVFNVMPQRGALGCFAVRKSRASSSPSAPSRPNSTRVDKGRGGGSILRVVVVSDGAPSILGWAVELLAEGTSRASVPSKLSSLRADKGCGDAADALLVAAGGISAPLNLV